MTSAWSLRLRDGVFVLTCGLLEEASGISHGFSVRRSEDDPRFDFASATDDSDAVASRRRRFVEAVGLIQAEPARLTQVHGPKIVLARSGPAVEADGSFWLRRERQDALPAVRTADCVPIILADRRGRAVAVLHAGWRGTAAGIARRGVDALAGAGIAPSELLAALGPAILDCCYEVDSDVLESVERASGGAAGAERPAVVGRRRHLDLHAANRQQLLAAGVPEGQVSAAPYCTRCREDLFFSYRRDGAGAGRHLAIAGPARRP